MAARGRRARRRGAGRAPGLRRHGVEYGGKRLRALLQYAASAAPSLTDDQIAAAAKEGWDGCRWWLTSCSKGVKCAPGYVDNKGRPGWRSPVLLPARKPPGVRRNDHAVHDCPRTWPGRLHRVLREYRDWVRYGSLPEPGTAAEQDAWTMEAFALLEEADALLQGHFRERAMEEARKAAKNPTSGPRR